MERRKLFSNTTAAPIQRRKLFCDSGCSDSKKCQREVQCMDCGYTTFDDATSTKLICPKCGGTRFNVISAPSKRISLFNDTREHNVEDSDFDKKLKDLSGKELSSEEAEKEFSMTTDELVEKGFCEKLDNGSLQVSDTAYLGSKIFSDIVITISRDLDLDKDIMCGEKKKEDVISGMAESGSICPKGIVLLKKAHGIPETFDKEGWVRDSGIINDLPIEFGGTKILRIGFEKKLNDRYPDAPEDILDILREKGILKIDGDQIEIIK